MKRVSQARFAITMRLGRGFVNQRHLNNGLPTVRLRGLHQYYLTSLSLMPSFSARFDRSQ
jgi:hypothetical protein